MSNPSKCISTAEMFFLKASISAEWHTSDLVWLRQKYKYHSQERAVTKGVLLILHPLIRDRVKFQPWTRAYIHTRPPTHQIHELIALRNYAPVVRSRAVKSSRNLSTWRPIVTTTGFFTFENSMFEEKIGTILRRLCVHKFLPFFIAWAKIELLMMMTVRIGKESFCKWAKLQLIVYVDLVKVLSSFIYICFFFQSKL